MKRLSAIVACMGLLGGVFQSSRAALLLDFDFSGVSGTTAYDPDTFNLTNTTFQAAHLNLVNGVNVFNPSVLAFSTGGGAATDDMNLNTFGTSTSTDIQAAINGFRFVSFAIQAETGYQLDLNSATVTFTVRRNGANAPQRYGLVAETAGGTIDSSDQVGSNVNFTDTVAHPVSATFPAAGFSGLTGPVEIRMYGWNAPNVSGNSHISDVYIDGGIVTVIPEPVSAGLLMVGVILAAGRRRRYPAGR